MKRIFWLFALSFFFVSVRAQTVEVIKITGTKFPFEIMQQWITEYTKTHAGVQFELNKNITVDNADLQIAAHGFRPEEVRDNQTTIALNRYIQLPIVNSGRSDLKTLQQKGFTQQDIKNIYFSKNNKQEEKSFTNPLTVYKRDKNVCASRSFAENVTGSQLDVAGTLVNGDDRALSAAVKNDINGISYNNLGFIYNLKTRKVIDSIAIVPIDLNENGTIDASEQIYTTLDDVLNYAGKADKTHLPQDNVNIIFNRNTISKNAVDFLNWIITKGQQYNRAFGFVSLDKNISVKEQQQLASIIKKDNSVASK